jgi:DnaJ-class molecular chaperone
MTEQKQCSVCQGQGYHEVEHVETVSHDMAIDAGDRSLEGQTVSWGVEQFPCDACEGTGIEQ